MSAAAAPRARIDLSAIVRNVRRVATGGDLVDLRRDAWGHGLAAVAEAILTSTDCAVRVDAEEAPAAGSPRIRTEGAATVGAATVLGVDGVGTCALTLVATILSVKTLRAGEGVSYGYTHRATADTRVALVTGGYGQGIPRAIGNRVSAAVAGERYPIIGRVAMDVCMLDVGDARVRRGDPVVLLADAGRGGPSVQEWADATGLGGVELLTALAQRNPREYAS